MLSSMKTLASASLRRAGMYESLVIAKRYHTNHAKKKKPSPFVSLIKNPNIIQNESKNTSSQERMQTENALHTEIFEVSSQINNSNLSKWLDDQFKRPETNIIDCVFAVCFYGIQNSIRLNIYGKLNEFINHQIQLLKEQLDSSSESLPSDEKLFDRQNLKLCASFLLANFDKINDRGWYTAKLQGLFHPNRNNQGNLSEEDILKYLTYSVSYIDASRRNEEIVSNLLIVKEYILLATHSMGFYASQQLQDLKSHGFRFHKNTQNELRLINLLIEEILLESKRVSPRFSKMVNDFLSYQQMIWLVANSQPNYELAVSAIIMLARYFLYIRNENSINNYFQLAILSMEHTIESLNQLPVSRFNYLCEVISEFPVYRLHYTLYEDFWLAAIKYILARKDQILVLQWRSLFYHVSKSGFITPEFVEQVFKPKMDPLLYKKSLKNLDLYKNFVNLMLLGFRNKLITPKDFAAHKSTLAELVKQHIYVDCENNMLNLYLQLCTTMCRNEIYDFELWKPFIDYFSRVDAFAYKVWYIFKHFEVFADSPELAEHAQTNMNFEELSKRKEIRDFMQSQSSRLDLAASDTQYKISTENSLTDILRGMNIKFEQEVFVGNLRVDFLLPDEKLVIERDGPDHYIKPAGDKIQFSDYREKVITKLGYNIISVPALGTDRNNMKISSDLYLCNELNKYFK